MFSVKEKGISNLFQLEYKDIIVASDFCHSFNLILKESLGKLPPIIFKFIKGICSHFGYSCIRRFRFKEVQQNLQEKGITDIKPILKYTHKQWSSLFEAAERIKLLWFSLEAYFDEIKHEEKNLPDLSEKNNLYLNLLCALLKR